MAGLAEEPNGTQDASYEPGTSSLITGSLIQLDHTHKLLYDIIEKLIQDDIKKELIDICDNIAMLRNQLADTDKKHVEEITVLKKMILEQQKPLEQKMETIQLAQKEQGKQIAKLEKNQSEMNKKLENLETSDDSEHTGQRNLKHRQKVKKDSGLESMPGSQGPSTSDLLQNDNQITIIVDDTDNTDSFNVM